MSDSVERSGDVLASPTQGSPGDESPGVCGRCGATSTLFSLPSRSGAGLDLSARVQCCPTCVNEYVTDRDAFYRTLANRPS